MCVLNNLVMYACINHIPITFIRFSTVLFNSINTYNKINSSNDVLQETMEDEDSDVMVVPAIQAPQQNEERESAMAESRLRDARDARFPCWRDPKLALVSQEEFEEWDTAKPKNGGMRCYKSPPGWPNKWQLHKFSAETLFKHWYKYRSDDIADTKTYRPPLRWNREWYMLHKALLIVKEERKLVDKSEVIDDETLCKWWFQSGRNNVEAELVRYELPDDPDQPQWPRLSRTGVKSVFPNLPQSKDNLEVLMDLVSDTRHSVRDPSSIDP